MHCPTCAQACEHTYDPLQGAHVDYSCACGQLLQWDYHLTSPPEFEDRTHIQVRFLH